MSPSSSRPRTTAFHAVDGGSNPPGDANVECNEERQDVITSWRFFVLLASTVPGSSALSACIQAFYGYILDGNAYGISDT